VDQGIFPVKAKFSPVSIAVALVVLSPTNYDRNYQAVKLQNSGRRFGNRAFIGLLVTTPTRAEGYKIMRQRFVNDLEKSLVKDFVVLCGGDPSLVESILKIPPS
jgi:hypothetical protein